MGTLSKLREENEVNMGVYIKGLSLNQLERNDGIIWGREGVKIPSDRVIEVPEPHGDLIDRSKIGVWWTNDARIAVDHARPVIEAEGE